MFPSKESITKKSDHNTKISKGIAMRTLMDLPLVVRIAKVKDAKVPTVSIKNNRYRLLIPSKTTNTYGRRKAVEDKIANDMKLAFRRHFFVS